jgi:hypothetical protein
MAGNTGVARLLAALVAVAAIAAGRPAAAVVCKPGDAVIVTGDPGTTVVHIPTDVINGPRTVIAAYSSDEYFLTDVTAASAGRVFVIRHSATEDSWQVVALTCGSPGSGETVGPTFSREAGDGVGIGLTFDHLRDRILVLAREVYPGPDHVVVEINPDTGAVRKTPFSVVPVVPSPVHRCISGFLEVDATGCLIGKGGECSDPDLLRLPSPACAEGPAVRRAFPSDSTADVYNSSNSWGLNLRRASPFYDRIYFVDNEPNILPQPNLYSFTLEQPDLLVTPITPADSFLLQADTRVHPVSDSVLILYEDNAGHHLRSVDPATGTMSTIAAGFRGPHCCGSLATSPRFALFPGGVSAVDPNPGGLDVAPEGETPVRDPEKSLIDGQGRIVGTGSGGAAVDRLATGGYPFEKVATDGVTPILLRAQVAPGEVVRFRIVGPGQGDQSQGTLQPLPLDGSAFVVEPHAGDVTATVPLPVQGTTTGYWAFAVWQAPAAYAAVVNPITVVAETTDETPTRELGRMEITAVPAPVLMIPGFGGGDPRPPEAGGEDSLALVHGRLLQAGAWVERITWSGNDDLLGDDFHTNPPVAAFDAGLRSLLSEARANGIATTRANSVGHSWGGVIPRRRNAIVPLENRLSLGLPDVYRFISLGAPHHGAKMANFVLTEPCASQIQSLSRWNPILGSLPGLSTTGPLFGDQSKMPLDPDFLLHAIVGITNPDVALGARWRRATLFDDAMSIFCRPCACGGDADCGLDGVCLASLECLGTGHASIYSPGDSCMIPLSGTLLVLADDFVSRVVGELNDALVEYSSASGVRLTVPTGRSRFNGKTHGQLSREPLSTSLTGSEDIRERIVELFHGTEEDFLTWD